MTDEEKIEAVTAKLTGEFHVGQRVTPKWSGAVPVIGVVTAVQGALVAVDWYDGKGAIYSYLEQQLIPL